MNQQNCPICDELTWLLFNELYEPKEAFSRPDSDRVVVLFTVHKCKETILS